MMPTPSPVGPAPQSELELAPDEGQLPFSEHMDQLSFIQWVIDQVEAEKAAGQSTPSVKIQDLDTWLRLDT